MLIRLTLLLGVGLTGTVLWYSGSVPVTAPAPPESIRRTVLAPPQRPPDAAPPADTPTDTPAPPTAAQAPPERVLTRLEPETAAPNRPLPRPPLNLTAVAPTIAPVNTPAPEPASATPSPDPRAERPAPPPAFVPAPPDPGFTPVPPELRMTLYVTGSRVNLRAGATTASEVRARLPRGTAVTLLGDAGAGWLRIRDGSGAEGYMSVDYLTTSPAAD
jgi:hypothetical protein